jgi:hypothetical protein
MKVPFRPGWGPFEAQSDFNWAHVGPIWVYVSRIRDQFGAMLAQQGRLWPQFDLDRTQRISNWAHDGPNWDPNYSGMETAMHNGTHIEGTCFIQFVPFDSCHESAKKAITHKLPTYDLVVLFSSNTEVQARRPQAIQQQQQQQQQKQQQNLEPPKRQQYERTFFVFSNDSQAHKQTDTMMGPHLGPSWAHGRPKHWPIMAYGGPELGPVMARGGAKLGPIMAHGGAQAWAHHGEWGSKHRPIMDTIHTPWVAAGPSPPTMSRSYGMSSVENAGIQMHTYNRKR